MLIVRWFAAGLIFSPWLLYQIGVLLFESFHLDNPGNHIALCIIGAAMTAIVAYVRFSPRWSSVVKQGFTGAWLGAFTGIALAAAYVSTWAHD